MDLKPIKTRYDGYLFRSRLEARWAVFLKALKMDYRYEPQGFDLDGLWYLPDFWLPGLGTWLEIKPVVTEMEPEDLEKVYRFQKALWKRSVTSQHSHFYVVAGDPWADGWNSIHSFYRPNPDSPELTPTEFRWTRCPLCGRIDIAYAWQCFSVERNGQVWDGLSCEHCDGVDRSKRDSPVVPGAYFHKGIAIAPPGSIVESAPLNAAYFAARSARFEHGESPG